MVVDNSPELPLEHSILSDAGVRLWVKREDLICPIVGGNKWRKLKYHFINAARNGKTTAVGFGGAYSNLLIALAVAGKEKGLKTVGIVRGEKVSNPALEKCLAEGMELIFVSRAEYRDKEGLFERLFGQDPVAFYIPEGGGGEPGILGASETNIEGSYDHIFCAVGTGTTMIGLLQNPKADAIYHGLVVLKGAEKMAELFANFNPAKFKLHFDFHQGGYAKTNKEYEEFLSEFAKETGLRPNRVYEGKMFFAIMNLAKKGYFQRGVKILALNNSGSEEIG